MKRKGFTLIELIVVIAIIAILATIILLALGNITPKAKRSSAVETLNRVLDAANSCVGEGFNLTEIKNGTNTGGMSFDNSAVVDKPVCATGGAAGEATVQANWPDLKKIDKDFAGTIWVTGNVVKDINFSAMPASLTSDPIVCVKDASGSKVTKCR